MVDIIKSLADRYPLEALLIENDVEEWVVVKFLVDEGFVNPNDYIYTDMEFIERGEEEDE